MKYFTKEWYKTMQMTSLHLPLKTSKRAEVFSEDYYKELYKREENDWLKFQKKIAEIKFEDIYPEEFYAQKIDGSPLDESEFEKAKKAYLERREQAKIQFETRDVFDPEQERKKHKQNQRHYIAVLKEKLPEYILEKVADIRVLALNVASAEVKRMITKYCKQNEKSVQSAIDAYKKYYDEHFGENAPAFVEDLKLHDCMVLSCRKAGNDIILKIGNSGGFTNINSIRIKNCEVITQTAPLHGAWCLYEEVYRTGNRYEIHFLLDKNKLIDFIVTADTLVYQYD